MLRGTLTLMEIRSKTIEAGQQVVINCIYEGPIGIGFVKHLDIDGVYHVMGQLTDGSSYNGAIKDNHTLCKIVAKTDDNRVITLKETLWSNAIKNRLLDTETPIDFNFVAMSFIPGPYLKICVSCESSFLANKRQHLCINCCAEHGGYVVFKAGKGPSKKIKRSRMLSAKTALRMAKSAFEAGRNSGVSFNEWSNTYNQHALHSDRNHTPGDE